MTPPKIQRRAPTDLERLRSAGFVQLRVLGGETLWEHAFYPSRSFDTPEALKHLEQMHERRR